jgi:adenine-specific DNA-methyltransferase
LGFEYRPLTEAESGGPDAEGEEGETTGKRKKKKATQATLNQDAVAAILKECAHGPFIGLAAPMPTEKNKTRTLLEKRLADYTARNTFDYFIHKDLGGFLRRELDFYVKNEVLHLDDIESAGQGTWETQLQKIKTLRHIAHRIIRFLALIEDFQRKLWLKKKFVVGCDYVLTLDRIPGSLYPEIAACETQREEWVRLFAIDEIEGYSVPLSVAFLKANQGLVVDTRHFGSVFIRKLIEGNAVHEAIQGVCFNSDNFQGLQFMQRRYREQVHTVYIDPPYNTGEDDFIYKDQYQRSSWLSLLKDRLSAEKPLLSRRAVHAMSIDDVEVARLREVALPIFGEATYLGTCAWRRTVSKPISGRGFATEHESIMFFAGSEEADLGRLAPTDEANYKNPDGDKRGKYKLQKFERTLSGARPTMTYPIESPNGSITRTWSAPEITFKRLLAEGRIAFSESGLPYYKQYWESMKEAGVPPGTFWHLEGAFNQNAARELAALFGEKTFYTVKPTALLNHILAITGPGLTLDYFAGSGTTGHAVINLNREDGGSRKYILIEMGEHFDTVLVPRLKKVIYSKDWKEGKPVNRTTGISHCFKVLRLESYEDTLNNLRLTRSAAHEGALKLMDTDQQDEYRLGYMLDVEAEGSASLLNVSAFTDPWDYTLDIASGSAGETRPTKVDLVETYHWLIGLTVTAQRYVEAPKSRKKSAATSGPMLSISEGTNPAGERVLVIWRKQVLMTSKALNEWITEDGLAARLGEFAEVHVNGDHHLDLLRGKGQTWTARLIDDLFPKLMWEGAE